MNIFCIPLYLLYFFLLVISPTFPLTIKNDLNDVSSEDSTGQSIHQQLFKRNNSTQSVSSEECLEPLFQKYRSCLKVPEEDKVILNLNYFCFGFHSETCRNFIDKGISIVPECNTDKINSKNMDTAIELMRMKLSRMDSDNRRYRKEHKEPKSLEVAEKEYYQYINETCHSYTCWEVLLNYNEEYQQDVERRAKFNSITSKIGKRSYQVENFKYLDDYENMKKVIEYIQTDDCKSTLPDNKKIKKSTEKSVEESDAGTINHTTSIFSLLNIFLCIVLFLY
ncbi:hypothetical protein PIROE2DRAFT_3492 [Piromyces sp. E2]|nr:hypothetical protein PIROE2DRAFT_3492 [Piromyces sp. E2]|eukprot:OUM68793.1 hypothetical protein PIROE2DRAFT_3492 [Piromyces sp. E2]